MQRIAITTPEIRSDEPVMIRTILDNGWDRIHLRHPDASLRDVRRLIESIPQKYHSRLRLHGHFALINEFNIGGLHLNHRCPAPPPHYNGLLSRSCHSIDEIRTCRDMEYVTLSPIFDSISKSGYHSAFSPAELQSLSEVASVPVIALGGVTPHNVGTLTNYGFAGFATLGYLMGAKDNDDLRLRLLQFDMCSDQN